MSIQLQVVKSRMYGNDFYLGTLGFAEVKKYILPPDDPQWDPIFGGQEEAQRKLNRPRVMQQMVPYLLKKDTNPFFSALTLFMVPMMGDDLQEGRDYEFRPSTETGIGTLIINGHVHFFPGDGQHRGAAIQEAVLKDRSLYMENVPVVLLPFKGKERVRQLFSDLNLNAKPVSKTIGLSFETRDPVVVVTKRIMREVPLFVDRVSERSNSLPVKSPDVVTMNTLYAAHTELLKALYPPKKGQKLRDQQDLVVLEGLDPGAPEIEPVAQRVADVWEVILGALPEWDRVMKKVVTPGYMREGDPDGDPNKPGYVFAYGIGWQALALAAAALIEQRPDDWSEDIARAIRAVDWRKGPHWQGIAMVGDRVNNTGPGVRATAGYVLERGGFTAEDDKTPIGSLLKALETSRVSLADLELEDEPA